MLRYKLYANNKLFIWKILRPDGLTFNDMLRLDGLAFSFLYCVRNYAISTEDSHSETEFFIISEQNSIFFGQEYKQDII